MALSIYTMLCRHHHSVSRTFYLLKQKLYPLNNNFPHAPFPQALVASLLSISVNLTTAGFSYKWNQVVFVSGLFYFTGFQGLSTL